MRAFSNVHYDTPWRQPMAINTSALEDRVVQTGVKMGMTSASARRLAKQPMPPSSDAAVAIAAKLVKKAPLLAEELEEAMGPDALAFAAPSKSTSGSASSVTLAHAGGDVGTAARRDWSGSAERTKKIVAEGGRVHPKRGPPSPAPHMDRHILRPKVPPMAGSVALAPKNTGPPRERVPPKGSVHDDLPPWRRSQRGLPVVDLTVGKPVLPTAPKWSSPPARPPAVDAIVAKQPELHEV